jgi:hypothetical protein
MKTKMMFVSALALVLAVLGCSEIDPLAPADDAAVVVKAEDATGNNLSFPVLWAEGIGVPLRGAFGTELFEGESTLLDGVPYYHQHDALNEWQAASADMSGGPLHVDWIDWGDNIESRAWPDRAKVRVEVVLYEDLAQPMTGYEMGWISGLGIDEMWGTSGVTYESTQATVYSATARMTIQKIADDPATADLAWDPALGQWVGDISDPFYNSGVWMEGSSPLEKYSAEINVKGKVIYGMLWDVAALGDGPGTYRLTFSFDGQNAPTPNNAFFDDQTQILLPVEEEETADKGEPVGGSTHIDLENNLTYVDLPIVRASGGGNRPHSEPGGGGGGRGGGRGGR